MRFTNVDVGRAYSDYLDSLDDWPPPDEARPDHHREASPAQSTDSEIRAPSQTQDIRFD